MCGSRRVWPASLVFVGFSALWGLAFTGFPYAVALRTGSPAAVSACYVIFFPMFFLSDAVVPKQFLTGWFSTIATYNPVTYLLNALRALIATGWQARHTAGRRCLTRRHRDREHGTRPACLARPTQPWPLSR